MEAPSLGSLLPSKVLQYLQRLASAITANETDISRISKSGFITSRQVQSNVDPTFLRNELQANGQAPLNVTNLVGKLAQPQLAGVPQVSALPAYNNPLAQDGALVRFNGLLYFFDQSVDPGVWKPVAGVGVFLVGTHAQRISATYTPPTFYPNGSIFYETDRTLLYISNGGFWEYLSGVFDITFAAIAALTATLTVHDVNLRLFVTDYDHGLKWLGTTLKWTWAEGDRQGGYVSDYAIDPDNVFSGWALCDGSATTWLKITAGVLSIPAFTTPNVVGSPAFKKLGAAYTGAIVPPVAPTATGITASGNANIPSVTSTGNSTSIAVPQGAGAAIVVAANPHTHDVAVTDLGHTHALTAVPISSTGEPQAIVFRPWFRR